MDRFSGGMALIILAVFFYLLGRKLFPQPQIFVSLLIMFSIYFCAALLIFSKKVFTFCVGVLKEGSPLRVKIVDFHDQLYFFKKNPKAFLTTMIFSFLVQFFSSFGFFVCSKAFNINVSIFYFLILVPIIMSIALVPITIAGAGLREGAAVYFFSLVGINKAIGLNLSLINLVFLISLGILGGITYVGLYNRCFQSGPQNPPA